MVVRRSILLALVLWTTAVAAQNYSSADTVTEYPNHGTYYHDKFEGRKTASGEIFDQNKFTAAHWRIKLGTYIMVTNRNTGLQVIVRVNDRCPKRGVIDMSHRAATAIGIRGCQPVTVRVLPDGYEERWAAQESQFDSVRTRLGTSPLTEPTPPANKETVKEKDIPVYVKDETVGGGYYLQLGSVDNHSDAYGLIAKLPDAYRERVVIDQPSPDESLTLSLDVQLNRRHADALRNALLSIFPHVQVMSR